MPVETSRVQSTRLSAKAVALIGRRQAKAVGWIRSATPDIASERDWLTHDDC